MARRRSVRATAHERSQPLPGDALIAAPVGSLTHAITIRAAAREVWPWLAQMGAGTRAGWYSYDMLDNSGVPSADVIVPQLQALRPGMTLPALPGVTGGFTLLAFEPEHHLVLGWCSDDQLVMTWAFVLSELTGGGCRLVVRARGGPRYRFHGLPWWASKPLVTIIHFIMQRKQLLGIAARAERPATRQRPLGEEASCP